MKIILSLALSVVMVSCANTNKSRNISSVDVDLSGDHLGVADYKSRRNAPDKAAIRVYFHPIEGEAGKYNAIIYEYSDLLKMAPSYIISNKLPFVAERVGFLNKIGQNISVYEVNPGEKEGTYELWPLVAQGDQIVAQRDGQPRILTLDQNKSADAAAESEDKPASPLAGATISSVKEGEPKEIFFPKKKDQRNPGLQYTLAKFAYETAKLKSTWRKEYLRGPYLSQYAKKDDVVLNLGKNEEGDTAAFVVEDRYARLQNRERQNRERIFTNPKSAFLKGDFKVIEPRDGMFLFQSVNADEATSSIVHNRIGLFIDVFDATEALNQDVVELAMISSENTEDFLMYYEHPDNGEGAPVPAQQPAAAEETAASEE